MAIANVQLTNTFDEWRSRHNIVTLNINQLQDVNTGVNQVAANTVTAFQSFNSDNDGSVTSPALNFTQGTQTGIYRESNGAISFTIGGINRLNVDDSGNIHVQNDVNASNGYFTDGIFNNTVEVSNLTDTNLLRIGDVNGTSNSITGIDYNIGLTGNTSTLPTSYSVKTYVDSGVLTIEDGTTTVTGANTITFSSDFSVTNNNDGSANVEIVSTGGASKGFAIAMALIF